MNSLTDINKLVCLLRARSDVIIVCNLFIIGVSKSESTEV